MTTTSAELLPCPFCGRELTRGSRRINPNARCATEDCYGAKMPVVNLDAPDSVSAWNTRAAPASPHSGAVEAKEARHALATVKALCCGEANDHGWARDFQTTKNRGRIADICDDALATLAPEAAGARRERYARALFAADCPNGSFDDERTFAERHGLSWPTSSMRRYYRDADAILALSPEPSALPFVAYNAALERAAQTAIRYGAALHVVAAIRDLKDEPSALPPHSQSGDVVEIARQYRESWRNCIDRQDSEASDRENWDGSDHNLQAFDRVMDFIAALSRSQAPQEKDG